MKKIWVVSEFFYPETISSGYLLTEISKYLSKDYDIEIICGPSFYIKNKKNSLIKQDINLKINRISEFTYNKDNIFQRLLANVIVSFRLFILMRDKIPKGASVLMVSSPIILPLIVGFFVKKNKWKINLLVYDIFPENLLVFKKNNFAINLFYPFVKFIYDTAFSRMHTLIALGRDMEYVLRNKTKNKVKIKIIPCWSDTDEIYSNKITNEPFIFLFAGNLGLVQGIDILLNAITLVNSDKVKFQFIGNGAKQKLIEKHAQQLQKGIIELFPWQPRENQNKFLSNATIGVVTLADGMYGLGVPSKFYNLLSAGKPIFYIGPKNSEIHLLIREYQIGWFVESGDIISIKKTIEEIINTNINTLQEYSNNSRKLAESVYNKDKVLKNYHSLFK